MDAAMIGLLLLAPLAFILLMITLVLITRRPAPAPDLTTPFQNMTQLIGGVQSDLSALSERLVTLERDQNQVGQYLQAVETRLAETGTVAQGLAATTATIRDGLQQTQENLAAMQGWMQADLATLSERLSTLERDQNQVGQYLQAVETRLAETGTVTQGLADTTATIRDGLRQTQDDLAALKLTAEARQQVEKKTAESIQRLESIIAGTQSKGEAGEHIIEAILATLPAEWQVRNFRVGNKAVEFGLRLPNDLILPVDSKWTATSLLEQFLACETVEEQQRLKGEIQRIVMLKARELRKYIDPHLTINFGIATVPDAIYDLCAGIQADIMQMNVVLVSYSLFLPYLLLVFQMILRTSQDVDLEKMNAYLDSAQAEIKALQDEIEGRFSRAITMLANSRDELRAHLSQVSTGLVALKSSARLPASASDLPPLGLPMSASETTIVLTASAAAEANSARGVQH